MEETNPPEPCESGTPIKTPAPANLIENPAQPPQFVGVSSLAEAKSVLRETARARLKSISPERRALESSQLRDRLNASDIWHAAKSVLFFAPLAGEPDLWLLLEEALTTGKAVALPRFEAATQSYVPCRIRNLQADLQIGKFGIREPAAHCPIMPLNQLDLTLVPGVAFDLSGRRLGRGKGFYDRLLHSVRGATCGLAFYEQIVDAIPVEPHDIRLNYILTPSRWQQASPARY